MSVTGGIFLYVTGGRTLWVAGHTPAPGENKPVQMLNFATPRELSRSFYLFDMPVHIVNDAATAAMVPGGKTAEDVIMAVNEFRRVCAEDQEFLLRRCYDPKKPPPPTNESTSKPMQQQQQQQNPMQPQQQQIQQLLSSMAGMTDGFGMTQNPAFNASNTNATQTALLLQLLQQRAATSQNASPFQQSPPNMAFNPGVAALGSNAMSAAGNMMLNNNGMVPNVPPMRYNTNYLNPMMTMGGRGDGLMPAPNAAYHRGPGMRHNPPQMMGGRGGGVRGGHLHNTFQSTVRNQPEPLPPLPPIPKDVLDTYMNPSQKLICATMPGPRCTVWLRAHEIPTDTKNQRYVFCKGGIVLMLKTKGSEVEHSKPVELFGQQLCAHFLIHNYCSRNNCLHRHHTEEQLRQLIAGKYMELKSMTKKERHSLSERLLEKEREGIAKAEEDRQRRAQEQMEAARRREAALNGNDGNSNNNSGGAVSASAETIRPPPAQTDVGNSGDNNNNNNVNRSDDKSSKGNNDGDGDTAVEREGSNDDSCASNFGNDKEDKNNKSKNNNNKNKNNNNKVSESPSRRLDHETKEKTRAPVVRRGGGPFASRRVVNPVDIGVTDDEDDDDRSSSSSASSLSATSSASADDCKDRAGNVSKLIDNKEEKEKEKEKEGNERHKSVDMPAVETSTEECAVVHNVENDDGVATVVERGNDAEVKNEEEKNENEETVKQADDAPEEKESEAVEKGKKENEEDEDEVSEVAEDENKKKPKEKAGGTKRTRSPVVKKSTAKGKRAKK